TVPDTFIAGVNQFREQGGNGIDQIIAEAYVRKIPGIDWPAAYSVLKHNADHRRTGAAFDRKGAPAPYRELGWIPSGEKDVMSVSFTQEYAQNDFSAALVAAGLGHADDARRYFARAQKWEHLWNPAVESDGFTGFMMPRRADDTWVEFDTKKYPGSWQPYFYEANSWTYSFFAPHQPERLIELVGGREKFIARLQHALDKNLLKLDNEPSFLIPQLFHHVGRPDLAAKTLHEITGKSFTLRGYPGDDDSGAMSSYYVWSKIGLFPNAGQDLYYVNGPAFPRVVVRRPGNAPLTITRTGEGFYVTSVKLDGKPLDRSWLRHAELAAATRLDFTMGATPSTWGRSTPPPRALPATP
ncbi:MAG: glycoside hydrolase family 92 protein, partial [Burkholderiales bacterium]|nr:glycoside hydrolase family 92 protein [Opitutaceae bacterium]